MPGGPGPLARAVEELAVAHVVAELELLVREQVAVRVQDALGEPGRAGRVVELGRVVGRGVGHLVVRRGALERRVEVDVAVLARAAHHEHLLDEALGDAVAVRAVGDDGARPRVAQPVLDALVAVEDRHRQQDRPALVGAEEDGRRLRQRRQQRRDAVAALDAVGLEHVREPVREVLQLAEADPALVALPVLPDHREPVALVLVADVAGDVVALRHLPAVRRAHLLVVAQLVLPEAHSGPPLAQRRSYPLRASASRDSAAGTCGAAEDRVDHEPRRRRARSRSPRGRGRRPPTAPRRPRPPRRAGARRATAAGRRRAPRAGRARASAGRKAAARPRTVSTQASGSGSSLRKVEPTEVVPSAVTALKTAPGSAAPGGDRLDTHLLDDVPRRRAQLELDDHAPDRGDRAPRARRVDHLRGPRARPPRARRRPFAAPRRR